MQFTPYSDQRGQFPIDGGKRIKTHREEREGEEQHEHVHKRQAISVSINGARECRWAKDDDDVVGDNSRRKNINETRNV